MVDKRYYKGIKLGKGIRMPLPTTEKLSPRKAIDALPTLEAAAFLLEGQQAAILAVNKVTSDVSRGADVMATAIKTGHSLIFAAAGSSGLMALADACELPGTFGISPDAIQIHMAGGVPADGHMPGDTEDDTNAAERATRHVKPGDAVIVLSASGTTPYALSVAKSAKAKGGTVIAIANNPASALLDLAKVAICLETPPEVIAGSTRLGAGTAQKAALNLMSSLMGIKLGHVYQGMMVNVVADNAKLVKRSIGIVAHIAGVPESAAKIALEQARGDTKSAILVAAGCTHDTATALLATHNGHLILCLHSLQSNQNTII